MTFLKFMLFYLKNLKSVWKGAIPVIGDHFYYRTYQAHAERLLAEAERYRLIRNLPPRRGAWRTILFQIGAGLIQIGRRLQRYYPADVLAQPSAHVR